VSPHYLEKRRKKKKKKTSEKEGQGRACTQPKKQPPKPARPSVRKVGKIREKSEESAPHVNLRFIEKYSSRGNKTNGQTPVTPKNQKRTQKPKSKKGGEDTWEILSAFRAVPNAVKVNTPANL